jgi:hypothetical protein
VRVALLLNPTTAASPQFFRSSIQDAASSLAVQVIDAPFHGKDEIEGIIAAQARNPGGGLIVMPDAFFFSVPNRNLIVAPAARYGVPTIYFTRLFVEEGGLVTALISVKRSARRQGTSTVSSRAPSPPICRSNCRSTTKWRSTSRPRHRSALTFRPRFSHAPTRWSNEAARGHQVSRRRVPFASSFR